MSAAPSALRGEGSLAERPSGGIKGHGSVLPVRPAGRTGRAGRGPAAGFPPSAVRRAVLWAQPEALQALLLSASGGRLGPCPLECFAAVS